MGRVRLHDARRQAIIHALEQAGELSVGELSEQFHVSEVTIRQDLQALAEQSLLIRTRGGARLATAHPELPFEVRQRQQAEQKARIGRAAAQMVQPGDSLVIDASTTALAMVPFLKPLPELTVLTNSLNVAVGLLRVPQAHVIMPGGSLRRDAVSLVGQQSSEFFYGLNARIGFFGARGFTLEQGLTDINLEEARTKRRMVEMCQVVVGILDGSKWKQTSVVTFAGIKDVNCIVTDESAPAELVQQVRSRGVEVIVV